MSDEGPSPILSSLLLLPPALLLQVNLVQCFPAKERLVKKKLTFGLKHLQQNKQNNMSVSGIERSSRNFEKYCFPSHLDRKVFLFLFTFKREDLWWTKSLGFQPVLTMSLANPLLQFFWLNSLFFPVSSLSSLCWLLQVILCKRCRCTSPTSATDPVMGKNVPEEDTWN